MKAIVAEIDKKQMIVITDKGDFIKVKRQMSATIGDEIELKPQKMYLTYKRVASIAACFLACIFLSTGVYAYYTPYSYVSVDINPSIALSLNRFERVISVNPLTEDAVGFINDTANLKNQDIDKALSQIIKSASEKGYIDGESESQVMVVVSTENPKEEEKLAKTVNTTASKELSKINKKPAVMVEKTSVENYKAALSNKVSPGKEILADKLREINPEIKDEEIREMSVKEVAKLIKEGRKAVKEAEKDNKYKDKGKDKDRDDEAYALNNKDKNKNNKYGDKKGGEKPKPSTAAKDNKLKNGSKEKGSPAAANEAEKDNKNIGKDRDKDKDKDKDKDDDDEDDEEDEDRLENGKKKDDNGMDKDNEKVKDKDKKNDDREQGEKDRDRDDRDKDDRDKDKGKNSRN